MRFIALLFLSAQAFVQAAVSTHFTFASAEGGSKTLVSWSFGGDYDSAQGSIWTGGSSTMSGWGVGWNLPVTTPMFSSLTDRSFTTTVDNSVFAMTNLTTSQISTGSVLYIESTTGVFAAENFYFLVNLNLNNGDAVRMTPSSGSLIIDMAFSEFNPGAYHQVTYGGIFTGSGTVLGAIPEPSTYGITLGALVLAGALVRRRAKRV